MGATGPPGRAFDSLNTQYKSRHVVPRRAVLLHLSFGDDGGTLPPLASTPARQHAKTLGRTSLALLLAPRSLISAVSLHFLARRALVVEPL